MAEQQDQDRTEAATPFKLREAKRRGQVAKSLEVNSLLILAVAISLAYLSGRAVISQHLAISHTMFSQAHQLNFDPVHLVAWFEAIIYQLMDVLWLPLALLMGAAVAGNMTQTGPVFSFFPLKPDIQRINPVAGFKRLFSKKMLFESVKTVVKIMLFAGVMYFSISAVLPALIGLMDRDTDTYAAFLLAEGRELGFQLLGAVFLVAIIDSVFSRSEFSSKMRMSRRELKDETKRREGDPQVRARIRELQREALKRAGSLRQVPNADVLITNPTHLAVALYYDRATMVAPKLIAKGAGELALKMREVARSHHVLVVENRRLARELFRYVDVDQPIKERYFPAVAKILVWVYAMRKRRDELASVSVREQHG